MRQNVKKKKNNKKTQAVLEYMCIQWTANSFFRFKCFPPNSTMMSPWTCCEPDSVDYHYRLIPSLFPLSRSIPNFLLQTLYLSPCKVVWLHFHLSTQTAPNPTTQSPEKNTTQTAHRHLESLLSNKKRFNQNKLAYFGHNLPLMVIQSEKKRGKRGRV